MLKPLSVNPVTALNTSAPLVALVFVALSAPALPTLVIVWLPALIPASVTFTVFVASVAFVMTSPLLSSLLLPAVTLSIVKSFFMLTVTVVLPDLESCATSVVKFEVSYVFVVSFALATISSSLPNLCVTVVPVLAPTLIPALVNPVTALNTSAPLVALVFVELSVPALATLLICWLPALIPASVTFTVFVASVAFVMTSPLLFSLLLPAVTLSTVIFFDRSNLIWLSAPAATTMFPSVFL